MLDEGILTETALAKEPARLGAGGRGRRVLELRGLKDVLKAVMAEERELRAYSRRPRLSHRIGAMHCDGGCDVVKAVLEITTTVVVA